MSTLAVEALHQRDCEFWRIDEDEVSADISHSGKPEGTSMGWPTTRPGMPGKRMFQTSLWQSIWFAVALVVTLALAILASQEGAVVAVSVIVTMATILLAASHGVVAITYLALGTALVTTTSIGLRLSENITVSDIALVIALVFASIAGTRLHPLNGLWRVTIAACGLVIVGGVLGNVISGNPEAGFTRLAQFSAATLACLLLVTVLRPSRRALTILVACYGFGALITAFVGLTENSNLRPIGLSLHSNHLALGCSLAASMLLAFLISRPAQSWKVAALLGWVVLVATVIASGSRAGLVGLIAATLLTLVGIRARRLIVTAGLLLVALVAGLVVGVVHLPSGNALGRLFGLDQSAAESDVGRALIYDRAWEAIYASPLLGSGFVSGRAGHSVYLQYWEAAGVLGLIGVMLVVGVSIAGWIISFGRRDKFSVILWSGFIGYLVAAIASNQMWDRYIWLALSLAILSSISWVKDPSSAQDEVAQQANERRYFPARAS